MSKLGDVLTELHMKARGRAGWQKVVLRHGLSLAMKRVEGGEIKLVLYREEMMPSVVEERTCLEHMTEELAPRARERHPEKKQVVYYLRAWSCPTCHKPLDARAKMMLRVHCSFCPENEEERRCKGCGIMVPLKASYVDWCDDCTTDRREGSSARV